MHAQRFLVRYFQQDGTTGFLPNTRDLTIYLQLLQQVGSCFHKAVIMRHDVVLNEIFQYAVRSS